MCHLADGSEHPLHPTEQYTLGCFNKLVHFITLRGVLDGLFKHRHHNPAAWFVFISLIHISAPGCEQEETQLNSCLVNALAANGSCGTADQIRANCPGANCPVGPLASSP